MLPYNKSLTQNSRNLRKNMTKEEKHLWYDCLKKLPITVNRQKNIGNYIVDFFIAEKRIVIEIDGAQHGFDDNFKNDTQRDSDSLNLSLNKKDLPNRQVLRQFPLNESKLLQHSPYLVR